MEKNNDEQQQIPNLPAEEKKHSSRNPYVIHDFDPPKDREMAVFTAARKLSEYIFVITERSPKKLRWSIVGRMQNTSVDIIENLYRANCERGTAREEYQKKARVSIRILDYFCQTALTMQAINIHQSEVIAGHLTEVDKLLSGWIRSTQRADKAEKEEKTKKE